MAAAAASTRIAAQPGMTRMQLCAVDEHVWGIQTPERKICGGGPGQQQFLLLMEAAIPHGAGTMRWPLPTIQCQGAQIVSIRYLVTIG
jgi:hypothetical protein